MIRLLFLCSVLLSGACTPVKRQISAVLETEPVTGDKDAADDPAIFYNTLNPDKHAIIATDKKRGLVIFDMEGRRVHEYLVGKVNNVDIRPDVLINGQPASLIGATNRTDNTLVFFTINPLTLELTPLPTATARSGVDGVYGFCMYRSSRTGKLYAYTVGKDGIVEQWEVYNQADGKPATRRVRTFTVGSQCEGMVADDEAGHLFISEEKGGIWRYPAEPDTATPEGLLVDRIDQNPALSDDLEGITLYALPQGRGYLIVSSQGNNTFAVYQRQEPHTYLGSFTVTEGVVDGLQETDGIEVTYLPLSARFPHGCLIAQDGDNRDGKEIMRQNFKFISWPDIARYFTPPLEVRQSTP